MTDALSPAALPPSALSAETRRDLLSPVDNPDPGLDYMIEFTARISRAYGLTVRYVPDRLILTQTGFDGWLNQVRETPIESPEALGLLLRADLSDVLVPRWLGVSLEIEGEGPAITGRRIWLEDRQPGWEGLPPAGPARAGLY